MRKLGGILKNYCTSIGKNLAYVVHSQLLPAQATRTVQAGPAKRGRDETHLHPQSGGDAHRESRSGVRARLWPRRGARGSACLGQRPGLGQRLIKFADILAAAAGAIGATAALAADNRGNRLNQFASLDLLGELGRHRRH